MNRNYADVRSVAQMLLMRELRDQKAVSLSSARIREVVARAVQMMDALDLPVEDVVAELEASFQTIIGAERQLVGDDDGWAPWLPKRRADIRWRFSDRYLQYLLQEKGWPEATLERLDASTDAVLGLLSDPTSLGAWDRRGMVVGHVQSGKTAHYVGLINKAADAGYKLIVVIAGFHKSLRSQTQIRLEEGFLGYDRDATDRYRRRVAVGVGDLTRYDQAPRANSITTRADGGDFKRALARNFGIDPGGHPLLFVVKKNGSVLNNLLDWVRWAAGESDYIKDIPLLVIDDEADQGSIDTRTGAFDEAGDADEEHNPTVLNGRIRTLLNMFDQSAYVGYTATPFANIFIHERGHTAEHGADLFPRSFILSLPTPSNYVGPSTIFGFRGPDEDPVEPLPIIREVTDHAESLRLDEDLGWVPPRHDKLWTPRYQGRDELPPTLREAIRGFVLVCAARSARGDATGHNSMLVHVTRFTAVQHAVWEQVQGELVSVQRRLRHGDGDPGQGIRRELQLLWEEDFEETTRALHERGLAQDCSALPWADVEPHIDRAAQSIEVREINGLAGEALDYLKHERHGLNVIAIGGDKLSRGLTLEGLSVSYFLRASRMYDTLMQMGRWFGYRPRFLDLCRLYTTSEMIDWFAHITDASEELREDFNRMAASGGTPRDFGHRVQSHPLLLVTSAVKMRNGTPLDLSFEGDISETVNFWRSRDRLEPNWQAAKTLCEKAERGGARRSPGTARRRRAAADGHTGPWVWEGVSPDLVLGFLTQYREHEASKKVKTRLLAEYIQEEVARGRLADWTVFLASGQEGSPTIEIGGARVRLLKRSWHAGKSDNEELRKQGHYRIRRLLSPTDEAADLTQDEWEKALRRTKAALAPDAGEGPDRPGGRQVREVRPHTRGLLLLYPLDPGSSEEAKVEVPDPSIPVLGFGISFPFVEGAEATRVRYVVNNVYWDQEFNAPEDYPSHEDGEGA